MARLAELEERMLRSGGGGVRGDLPEAPIERERRLLRIYFGIGLACSGVAGSIALLVMLALAAGPAHEHWFGAGSEKSPLVLYDALPRPQVRSAPVKPTTVEMLVPRSERGGVRLALEQVGADLLEAQKADGFVAVLRNVPQSVSLSRGTREDAQTWRLNRGDLQHLYLSLGHDAPATFVFDLDVGVGPGAAKPTATVQVRLVDAPQVVPRVAPVATLQPILPGPSVKPSVGGVEKAVRQPRAEAPVVTNAARVKTPRAPDPPAVKAASVGISPAPVAKEAPAVEFTKSEVVRPQGMSSLGGPGAASGPGKPDTTTLFGRQVWWRLPAATAWSPFKDAGVR